MANGGNWKVVVRAPHGSSVAAETRSEAKAREAFKATRWVVFGCVRAPGCVVALECDGAEVETSERWS